MYTDHSIIVLPYTACLQDQSCHYCLNDVHTTYTVCKMNHHTCEIDTIFMHNSNYCCSAS